MIFLFKNFKYFNLKGKVVSFPILSKLVFITYEKLMETYNKPKYIFFKTRNRQSIVLPIYKDYIFFIYNGLKYQKLKIVEDFFGYKLGDFIPTRQFIAHKRQYKPTKSGIRNKKQLIKRNTRVLRSHVFFNDFFYSEKKKYLNIC